MPTNSKDEFLFCLRASKVVSESAMEEALAEIKSEDPRYIAKDLVRRNLLTLWQAKFLISGRKQLHLGNYQLLDRISRGEQGDRFLAVHTALDRKVEIQLLPQELSDDQDTIDQFIQKASRASTIDHPNLVHVYDIDQERGRYYLVEEHVGGQPLAEMCDSLSELELAKVLRQAFSGLLNAHQNQVVHGQVKASNLLLSNDKNLKIANLSLTPLVQTDVEEHSVFDMHDAASIGRDLIAAKTNGDATALSELDQMMEQIGNIASQNDIASPLENLSNWIQLNDPNASTPSLAPVTESPKSAPAKRSQFRTAEDDELEPDEIEKDSFADTIKKHPAIFLSVVGATALIILGATAWIAIALTRNNPEPIANNKTASTTVVKKPAIENKTSTNKNAGDLKQKEAKLDDPEALNKVLANLPTDTNALEPVAKNFPGKKEPIANKNVPVPVATPPTKTDADNEKSSAANVAANKQLGQAKPVEIKTPTPATKSTDEFQQFPKLTGLPSVDDVTPYTIGEVNLAKNYLLGLELISGKSISKSKINFEIKRTEDDKQKWEVHLMTRPQDPPLVIGHFFKTGTNFGFQWTDKAAEQTDANFIRNCLLKLKGKNKKTIISLREPVNI